MIRITGSHHFLFSKTDMNESCYAFTVHSPIPKQFPIPSSHIYSPCNATFHSHLKKKAVHLLLLANWVEHIWKPIPNALHQMISPPFFVASFFPHEALPNSVRSNHQKLLVLRGGIMDYHFCLLTHPLHK